MSIPETETCLFYHFIAGNPVEKYGDSSEPVMEAFQQSFSQALSTEFHKAVELANAFTNKDSNLAPLDIHTILKGRGFKAKFQSTFSAHSTKFNDDTQDLCQVWIANFFMSQFRGA